MSFFKNVQKLLDEAAKNAPGQNQIPPTGSQESPPDTNTKLLTEVLASLASVKEVLDTVKTRTEQNHEKLQKVGMEMSNLETSLEKKMDWLEDRVKEKCENVETHTISRLNEIASSVTCVTEGVQGLGDRMTHLEGTKDLCDRMKRLTVVSVCQSTKLKEDVEALKTATQTSHDHTHKQIKKSTNRIDNLAKHMSQLPQGASASDLSGVLTSFGQENKFRELMRVKDVSKGRVNDAYQYSDVIDPKSGHHQVWGQVWLHSDGCVAVFLDSRKRPVDVADGISTFTKIKFTISVLSGDNTKEGWELCSDQEVILGSQSENWGNYVWCSGKKHIDEYILRGLLSASDEIAVEIDLELV